MIPKIVSPKNPDLPAFPFPSTRLKISICIRLILKHLLGNNSSSQFKICKIHKFIVHARILIAISKNGLLDLYYPTFFLTNHRHFGSYVL